MEQEKRWLQFCWNGQTYAVPMEDVGGIIRRDRFEQANEGNPVSIQYLHEGYLEGTGKWVIILRNHAFGLQFTADRIIGEVGTGKNISRENDVTDGLFSIWKLDSKSIGENE